MLTHAQYRIVKSLAKGHSASEIALQRNVKISTIYRQMDDARRRADVRTTHQLVALVAKGETR